MLSQLKSILPWWAKIGTKLIFSRMPIAYGVWQRAGLFRHGDMDSAEYALSIFDEHITRAGLVGNLQGKVVLEMGPGDSVATAIIASAFGAKAIMVDAGKYAANSLQPYYSLTQLLKIKGLNPPDIGKIATIDELLRICNGQYLTKGLESWKEIPSESVDLIFSQAVLEHVRKSDFVATQKECFRVLKSNAVATHRVDLRDHLGGALNNLRFSMRVWESDFFANSGFYTNRIGFTGMLDSFKTAGFVVVPGDVRRWENLPTPKNKMAQEFRDLPDSELSISGFDVLLRKSFLLDLTA